MTIIRLPMANPPPGAALIYKCLKHVRQEDEMAAKDAEMPTQKELSDDIQEIANHLANLRKDLEALTGQIRHWRPSNRANARYRWRGAQSGR